METAEVGNKTTVKAGRKRRWASIRRYPVASIAIVLLVVLCAIFAPLISRQSPYIGDLSNVVGPAVWQKGGSMTHILGTDHLGRDVLSRLIYGSQISLIVAVCSILLGATAGTVLGMFSAYLGGWVDSLIMRVTDTFLAMPNILIAIVMVAVVGPSLMNIIIVISVVTWAQYARMIRGEALSIRERNFIALATIAGSSKTRIVFTHILPNVTNTLIVLATLNVGQIILLEATLSFLGLGIPPPTPTWGRMVADGRDYIASAWWLAAFPGFAIMVFVLAMNFLGDWLRDTLDPRRRQL